MLLLGSCCGCILAHEGGEEHGIACVAHRAPLRVPGEALGMVADGAVRGCRAERVGVLHTEQQRSKERKHVLRHWCTLQEPVLRPLTGQEARHESRVSTSQSIQLNQCGEHHP